MALAQCGATLAIALLALPERTGAVEFVREDIRIPVPAAGPRGLEGMLLHTDEPGRHPLVLTNHGSPRDAADRPGMSPFQLYLPAIEFVRRGWTAAVVMRRNFGDSGGAFEESMGSCNNTNYLHAASAATADLKAATALLAKRPDIDASRILSVGVSAGGFATVALTAAPSPGLVAAISFAGGRGSDKPDSVCQPDREVAAFAEFGKRSRIPMLWVYAENDHFFGPALAERFRAAFTGGGGRVTFVKAAPYGSDGHALFSAAGIPLWTPMVDDFLKAQNVVLRAQHSRYPQPAPLAGTGAFGWASARRSVDAAKAAALGFCPQPAKDCRVVAIDDAAVP